MTTLVSIIMTVKNEASYIGDCLESIIAQSYHNWEVLIVDDHSTDDTANIIESYVIQDDRIRKVYSNGKGIIEGLRGAYASSKGEMITRMDGDDLMRPDKIALLVDEVRRQGKGSVAVGCVEYFSDTDLGDGFKRYAIWLNDLTKASVNYQEIYKECVIPSACWMMYRSDFEDCGGFNLNTYPEDYDLAFRMRKNKLRICGIDSKIHLWRDHPKRSSRNDINYADNKFLDLKLLHFLDQDYKSIYPTIVWGAGKKGKALAATLLKKDHNFRWITGNPHKACKEIYGVQLEPESQLATLNKSQVIIMISSPEDQEYLFQKKESHPQHTYYHWT